MKIKVGIIGAAVLAAAIAVPASAQVAGLYSGTSADGQQISFTVGTDGSGALAVISAGVAYSAPCRGSTYVLNSAWGFGLDSVISPSRVAKVDADGNYFTITANIVFSADGQSATGSITSYSTTLDPVGAHPTKSLYCTSPKQNFSLSLQPVTSKVPVPTHEYHGIAIK